MALGVKIKNIKTNNSYTIESLYEAIKDVAATIITFPALDSQNQVWIMKSGFSKESQKFSIQKSEEAGLGNTAKNMALDSLTNGIFGFGSMLGGNAKKCEQLVDATAKELSKLNL
mgnify:CR=1 FL=1